MINVEELAKEAERLRNGERINVVQEVSPLILSLDLEANRIKNNVLDQVEEENETEDIEFEDIEDEEYFGGYYNNNGSFIEFSNKSNKGNLLEDGDILLCNDGTFCSFKRCLWNGESYVNPYTTSNDYSLVHDNNGFAYSLKLLPSYSIIATITGSCNTFISKTQINLHPDIWIYVKKHNGYINTSELQRNNWVVEEGIIKIDPKFNKDVLREELIIKYPYFEQIVNSIFPEGEDYSWDYLLYGREFCFVIKFKKIVITNSYHQKHVIRDLYILLPFNKDFKFTGNLMGTRGEISFYENELGYLHSHLRGHGVSDFCLGSGPIRDYISRFNISPDENELFNVIYNIKIYSAWESIEGRPYKRIRDLGKKEIDENSHIFFNENDLLEKYIKSDHQIPINLTTVNGVKTLVVNKNILEKQLVDFFSKSDSALVYKDITHNTYYSVASLREENRKLPNKLFTFKGEDIYTTVKSYNNEIKVQDKEFYAHPKITFKIQEWFSKRINDHIIQKETGFSPTTSTIISFD